MRYDYLIVGAGLFGCTFANLAAKAGKKVLVIDKRPHLGGNVYCEEVEGITVHKYGPHIFHTSDEDVYRFVRGLVKVHPFTNSPLARYGSDVYNLPFNMNTFSRMWGVVFPDEAKAIIKKQSHVTEISNLEDKAISLVGRDLYEKLIKGYTEKQWGRKCTELPASIIERIPVRFTYDNRYFNDLYEFIPVGGYNNLISALLTSPVLGKGEIMAIPNIDYFHARDMANKIAEKVVFTGRIDQYFDFKYGELEYRSLQFDNRVLNQRDYQGNAVVNYTDAAIPHTRIVEHRHFEQPQQDIEKTVVTYEYPAKVSETNEPFYPINDERNSKLYLQYKELADKEKNVLFGGRLADYRYYDMDDVILKAMELWKSELNR